MDKHIMASLKRTKNNCSVCIKLAGVFLCHGCEKNFCQLHASEHREHLQKSMNVIYHNYDSVKQNIKGQTTEQYQHSLMVQVNQWEQESIEKIRQYAQETRQELTITVRQRSDNLKEKLEQLKQELDKARQTGGFYENDLKEWTEKLNEIRRTFAGQQTININEASHSTPFISRFSFNATSNSSFQNEYHSRTFQHQHQQQQQQQQQQLQQQLQQHYDYDQYKQINHSHFDDLLPAQIQTSYSSGQHKFQYVIERYETNSSILFGIISELTSSDEDPYRNSSFYGWGSNDLVYLGGKEKLNYNKYRSDYQTGGQYELTIDCDEKKITLKNEHTSQSYELTIDLHKCPFPWQQHVRLWLRSNSEEKSHY
ncbi:unnamed protein product [Adineta steineri]|uniref:B box-type domain-containing protein n=1 Tax=Adineta steineri TaxID=433720 RepID=A0A819KUL4_9BILA|nr:unnamed protein product [Adineta steineri]CAF3952348.1 unnamed protein product [Adineta steineri]